MEQRESTKELFGRARVEALSDGVFAIVVTLLVLEMKVPHVEDAMSIPGLAASLFGLGPKFVSWVISFATVCVIWLNHHRLFGHFTRMDAPAFWLNANLLLWVSFIPFPTALIGDYPRNSLALSLYGLVMLLMALGFVLLRIWLLKADLLGLELDKDAFRAGTRWAFIMGPCAYAAGAVLAWVQPILSFLVYGGITAYFILPHSLRSAQPRQDA